MKWIISRQRLDSPPQQRGTGASEPISELTSFMGKLFYPNLFPSQINVISLKTQEQSAPLLTQSSDEAENPWKCSQFSVSVFGFLAGDVSWECKYIIVENLNAASTQ